MNSIFYKYKSINDYFVDSLENYYFYYSRPDELNDPFDGKIAYEYDATDVEIINWANRNSLPNINIVQIRKNIKDPSFLAFMESGKKKLEDKYNILCLSENWNESMMWAHYANSNKGICIGYKVIFENNAFLLELDKRNSRNIMFFEKDDCYLCALLKVDYNKINYTYNPFHQNQDAIKNGFYSKEPKWKYENEYRSIIFNMDNNNIIQKVYYKKNIVKEIIFGSNTSSDDIKTIVSVMNRKYEKNIHYFQISTDIRNSLIDRVPLNI
jgi:hypothetical protein